MLHIPVLQREIYFLLYYMRVVIYKCNLTCIYIKMYVKSNMLQINHDPFLINHTYNFVIFCLLGFETSYSLFFSLKFVTWG